MFLEGGVFINYSHEDWWPFGANGWVDSTEDLTWKQVPDHVHTVQQQYLFELLDQYVADPTWAPDDGSFLSKGTGSGGTKAAAGRSDTAAIAYFPSKRSVVVDTTVIGGAEPVRLRWYDPTTGTYTTIAASEAQQADRSVPYPPAHPDGPTTGCWWSIGRADAGASQPCRAGGQTTIFTLADMGVPCSPGVREGDGDDSSAPRCGNE